ncbi:hypothetical protein POPTR_017G149500v4 [Populus trichocarpa]|jgi:hypothetical protein|uniref:Uncharacterized protein n=1 Tax=Populus trichocarpa TaxID=3694 RepID=B9MX69_POPTR|nr:hypothetical protein POPTR_017G149500v4 [Populus trichocarpa]
MDCAEAVADGDLKLTDFLFEEMEVLAAKETRKVTKIFVSCFAEALARRAYGVLPRNPVQLLPSLIVKYQCCPFQFLVTDFHFGGLISRKKAVHCVVFYIMEGSWEYGILLRECERAPVPVFWLTSIGPNPGQDSYPLLYKFWL